MLKGLTFNFINKFNETGSKAIVNSTYYTVYNTPGFH